MTWIPEKKIEQNIFIKFFIKIKPGICVVLFLFAKHQSISNARVFYEELIFIQIHNGSNSTWYGI